MIARIICASCQSEFETDVRGETLCATCDRRQWLEHQERLEAELAERRRAKMQGTAEPLPGETPCPRCGYLFDFGSHGARMCPACIAQDQFDMRGATTIAGAYAWLKAKLTGRKPTIH